MANLANALAWDAETLDTLQSQSQSQSQYAKKARRNSAWSPTVCISNQVHQLYRLDSCAMNTKVVKEPSAIVPGVLPELLATG